MCRRRYRRRISVSLTIFFMETNTSAETCSRAEFARLEQKIDAIYISTEKTRKYFLYTLLISAAMVLLPLIGLMFAIPTFLGTYSSIQESGLLEGL